MIITAYVVMFSTALWGNTPASSVAIPFIRIGSSHSMDILWHKVDKTPTFRELMIPTCAKQGGRHEPHAAI